MICIIGKTSSGKTTIVKKLTSLHSYKQIITYTTRGMRKGEKQDIDYHFISDEYFKYLIEHNFFAEWKSYETVQGTWYYGTALKDLEKADDKTLIILTPDGYRDIIKKLKNKPKCIYIYANNETIKNRLIGRGDDEKEAHRRLKHDNEDFKDFEYETDKIFYNNDGTDLDEVVERILRFVG